MDLPILEFHFIEPAHEQRLKVGLNVKVNAAVI